MIWKWKRIDWQDVWNAKYGYLQTARRFKRTANITVTIIRADKVLIDAPLEKVWQALIDVENYPRWNPFTTRVETTFVVGEPAILYVTMNGQHQRVQHEAITVFEPQQAFAWASIMGAPFILKTSRRQIVEALDDQRTQYETYETFDGLLAPLVMALYRKDIQHGFEAVGVALKKYVEAPLSPNPSY
jgi:hypothetical protein